MKIFLFLLSAFFLLGQTTSNLNLAQAGEEFRWGVQAFHSGTYNEAILSFSRSLSFNPENLLVRQWLGIAQLAAGFADSALQEWNSVRSVQQDAFLNYFADTIAFRKNAASLIPRDISYTEAASLPGMQNDVRFFFRPAGVRSQKDGTFYLVSTGTNQVLWMNGAGNVLRKEGGSIGALDLPFDIAFWNEFIFISELGSDHISRMHRDGGRRITFGGKGSDEGKFHGPQHLAVDSAGYLYVTDWGNKRVQKFDVDGNFLLSFGGPQRSFPGFSAPTGVILLGEEVIVADRIRFSLDFFDSSGNHLRTQSLPERQLESLRSWGENTLLIGSDRNVILYDVVLQRVVTSFADERAVKLVGVDVDVNGNILVADMGSDELRIYMPTDEIYSGLFIWIEKVRFTEFPTMVVELQVQDRRGNPVMGLGKENFFLAEDAAPVDQFSLVSQGDMTGGLDAALLLEGSSRAETQEEDLQSAIQSILREVSSVQRSASLFTTFLADDDPRLIDDVADIRYTPQWEFDRGLRLSAASLLQGSEARRSVFFVTTGDFSDQTFSTYSLQSLADFLTTNRIRFEVVLLNSNALSPELEYLATATKGRVSYVYDDVSTHVKEAHSAPSGYYVLQYISKAEIDFGRRYIPLSVEVQHFIRSGRISSGYFAPLEF